MSRRNALVISLAVLAALVVVAVLVGAITVAYLFGSPAAAKLDESELTGTWVSDDNASTLTFEADGNVALTNFQLITDSGNRSVEVDRQGQWWVTQETGDVGIDTDEPIFGLTGVGLDAVTCGADVCLSYGPDDGTAIVWHRQPE